tara:strand:+ start:1052 stop:1348 length:297 start_codon:yes stop_codon:yes gene_type:complete
MPKSQKSRLSKSQKSMKAQKKEKKPVKKSKKGGKLGPINLNELEKNSFYCVKCRALCFSRKPDVKTTVAKNGRPMLKGRCANKSPNGGFCGTKVQRFY